MTIAKGIAIVLFSGIGMIVLASMKKGDGDDE